MKNIHDMNWLVGYLQVLQVSFLRVTQQRGDPVVLSHAAGAAVPPQGEDLADHRHAAQCTVGKLQNLWVADLLQEKSGSNWVSSRVTFISSNTWILGMIRESSGKKPNEEFWHWEIQHFLWRLNYQWSTAAWKKCLLWIKTLRYRRPCKQQHCFRFFFGSCYPIKNEPGASSCWEDLKQRHEE